MWFQAGFAEAAGSPPVQILTVCNGKYLYATRRLAVGILEQAFYDPLFTGENEKPAQMA